MASEKGVLASGLESDSQSIRRRNVLSTSPDGGMVNRVEIDDKKTQIKKVRAGKFLEKLGLLFSPAGADFCLFNRKSRHY
jgi:dolichyl-phosphate-mannose-protein mannosyltransferase